MDFCFLGPNKIETTQLKFKLMFLWDLKMINTQQIDNTMLDGAMLYSNTLYIVTTSMNINYIIFLETSNFKQKSRKIIQRKAMLQICTTIVVAT